MCCERWQKFSPLRRYVMLTFGDCVPCLMSRRIRCDVVCELHTGAHSRQVMYVTRYLMFKIEEIEENNTQSSALVLISVFWAAFAKFGKVTFSFVMSVCPSAWKNWTPTGRIFMKLDLWAFFENLSVTFQVSLKADKNNGYFTRRRFDIFDDVSLNSS
jgi:hypothetical protein